MFTLRCTQKLLRRGLVETAAASAQATTVLGDWYANVVITRPSHLVVCVSERTLLPVVVAAKEPKHLPQRVAQALVPLLQALEIEPSAIERELSSMQSWQVGRTASKSVVGSLNEFIFFLEHSLRTHPKRSLLEHSLYLAQVPMKGAERSSPDRATSALFASAAVLGRVRARSAL
jgi:hypothetical protein